jgi:hypothetical protein
VYGLKLQSVVSVLGAICGRIAACLEMKTYIILRQEMEGTEHFIIVKLETLRRLQSLQVF